MIGQEIKCGEINVGVFFKDHNLALLFPPKGQPDFFALGDIKTLEAKYRDLVNDGYCYSWELGEDYDFRYAWLEQCLGNGEPKANDLVRTLLNQA